MIYGKVVIKLCYGLEKAVKEVGGMEIIMYLVVKVGGRCYGGFYDFCLSFLVYNIVWWLFCYGLLYYLVAVVDLIVGIGVGGFLGFLLLGRGFLIGG